MAVVTQTIWANPSANITVQLTYNTVTQSALSLRFVHQGPSVGVDDPLIFWYTVGGVTTTLQANRGLNGAVHTFASAIVGKLGGRGGTELIFFDAVGGGQGTVPPSPPIIVTAAA